FEGTRRTWGYACSPLAYKNMVIVFTGGKGASIVALDQTTGGVVWKAHDFENSFASPVLIQVDGQTQLVCFMAKEVVGLDPDNGRLLWQHPHANQWRNNISNPVWCEGNLLFISSEGHGGSRVLELTRSGGGTKVRELWASRKMRISHRNAIRIGRCIYASSGDFGPAPFTAVDVTNGRIAWQARGLAEAGAIFADGKLILLDEDGHLALATAAPESFTLHAKIKLLGREAWTIPTLVGRRLYLRDRKIIMALELP
ncbi:MAG: PQQ-binding-like beta-propeller repeat protein, partial [Planctomycetota bacterium]